MQPEARMQVEYMLTVAPNESVTMTHVAVGDCYCLFCAWWAL